MRRTDSPSLRAAIAIVLWMTALAWNSRGRAATTRKSDPHPAEPEHAVKRRVYRRRVYRHRYYHRYYRRRIYWYSIQPDRVREIQQALKKAGFLSEDPTGRWDEATRMAMKNYQTANGFKPTGLPEAKPLMKLGLGPHPLPPGLAHSAPVPAAKAQSKPSASTAPSAGAQPSPAAAPHAGGSPKTPNSATPPKSKPAAAHPAASPSPSKPSPTLPHPQR